MEIPVNIELYNEVLSFLGKEPYEKSFQLINKLQSNAQMHMVSQASQTPPAPIAEREKPESGEVLPSVNPETSNTF
jgi:hypothetical protein